MSSISFPGYVATLARRLFNVVSTISISSHCYGLQDERRQRLHLPPEPFGETEMTLGKRDAKGSRVLTSGTIPIPLLNRNWWSSVFSWTATERSHSEDSPPPLGNQGDANGQRSPQPEPPRPPSDPIHQLMMNPALRNPLRTPRNPIVLCHGLYGFDERGPASFPSLRMHYWTTALRILRGIVGAEVIVTSVPGTGSIQERATRLDEQLKEKARTRGVNFLAHSMGGLDCRHLITHIKPSDYTPLSLTTVSTPHRGSPFMDWCVDNIGIGKLRQEGRDTKEDKQAEAESRASALSLSNLTSLPSSFTTLLLSTVDSPAYANLTTTYLNEVFNPSTPNDPNVKYFSVTSRVGSVSVLHPFWFTKLVVDGVEEKERARLAAAALASGEKWKSLPKNGKVPMWADERYWGNDGLVTVQSAQWGEFLGILDNCDHWEIRGARGIEFGVDLPAIPVLGLGSAPPPSSVDEPNTTAQSKADAWYLREWTRFVSGWVRGNEKDGKKSSTSQESAPASIRKSPSPPATAEEKEENKRKRQELFTKGDQVVRASTDKLSTIFDWMVDQVPNTQVLPSAAELPEKLMSSVSRGKTEKEESAAAAKSAARDAKMRKLGAQIVQHMVAGSSSKDSDGDSGSGPTLPINLSPDAKPETLATEMKKIMERERKGWRKNELATKADLERFYISLSRKMWDEGM